MACYDEVTKALDHTGKVTERAALMTLSKMIDKTYVDVVVTSDAKELRDLERIPEVAKCVAANKVGEFWETLSDEQR